MTRTILIKITDNRQPHRQVMRELFHNMIQGTPRFQHLGERLEAVEKDGAFSHYKDDEVDTLWIGFALGLRCAQRISDHLTSIYSNERPTT